MERHDAILVPLAPNPQTARFARIVATAGRDDLAFALLKELGMPFRGDDKKGTRL